MRKKIITGVVLAFLLLCSLLTINTIGRSNPSVAEDKEPIIFSIQG